MTTYLRSHTEIADFFAAAPQAVVSVKGQTQITRQQMHSDWQQAQHALLTLNSPRFVLYEEDTYSFLVWLLAAWSNGQTALLAAEDLPDLRHAFDLPWVGASNPANALRAFADVAFKGQPSAPHHEPGVAFFTSGSTGQARLIHKTPGQLWREAAALDQVFGHRFPPGTRFVGTVPHQHMFGLPFRLFFPFCSGQPMLNEMFRYPEDLMRLQEGSHVLISSPATLKRLAQLPHVRPAASILAVFAAGSPLPADVALTCKEQLNTKVVEIYGSTETGYVASREAPDIVWHEQPGVQLDIDADSGCLKIRSPLLPNDDWYQTQDRVEKTANGWQILGRADRIAKIEGQRVSLDLIENTLKEQIEVVDVRVAPIYGEREEIVAAVVLNEDGYRALKKHGKAAFERMLRQRLRANLTRAAIPRRWRFPRELPHNAMGKTTQQDIVALFRTLPLPAVEVVSRTASEAQLRLPLKESLFAFDGHFPELPVLPGVTQVDWAIRLAQRYLSLDKHVDIDAISSIAQLKFQRLIRPSDTLLLNLTLAPQQLKFSYTLAERPAVQAAQGCVRFQAEAKR